MCFIMDILLANKAFIRIRWEGAKLKSVVGNQGPRLNCKEPYIS